MIVFVCRLHNKRITFEIDHNQWSNCDYQFWHAIHNVVFGMATIETSGWFISSASQRVKSSAAYKWFIIINLIYYKDAYHSEKGRQYNIQILNTSIESTQEYWVPGLEQLAVRLPVNSHPQATSCNSIIYRYKIKFFCLLVSSFLTNCRKWLKDGQVIIFSDQVLRLLQWVICTQVKKNIFRIIEAKKE